MNFPARRFFDPDVCRGYADYIHDREPKARGDKRRDRITRWLLLRTANALEQPRRPYPSGDCELTISVVPMQDHRALAHPKEGV